ARTSKYAKVRSGLSFAASTERETVGAPRAPRRALSEQILYCLLAHPGGLELHCFCSRITSWPGQIRRRESTRLICLASGVPTGQLDRAGSSNGAFVTICTIRSASRRRPAGP